MLLGSAQRVLKGEDKFTECKVQIGRDPVFFGVVADGHGGTFAAEYCKRNIVRYICEGAAGDSSGAALRRAGSKAFSRLHEEVRASGHTDGTTLTVVMVNLERSELSSERPAPGGGCLKYKIFAKQPRWSSWTSPTTVSRIPGSKSC